ncbi:MAG: hypothetical protein J7K26_00525 [Candidatus Aenigmarchaeota archaeon]|nr:hypothetical protein [Candidatus Aenigmarchaeota archaeon]
MWLNPLSVFGILSIPIFISNLLTVILFLCASLFTFIYTIKFYENRKKPKRWFALIFGLLIICISEFGQFLLPYMIQPAEDIFRLILLFQNIGIMLIAIFSVILFLGASK